VASGTRRLSSITGMSMLSELVNVIISRIIKSNLNPRQRKQAAPKLACFSFSSDVLVSDMICGFDSLKEEKEVEEKGYLVY
jgi:hypothetical protein